MPSPKTAPTLLRKDAERNRQLLIAAAKKVFAEQGFSATLHQVAQQAGVGVGTVYRRFSNKQELMLEIYEEQIEELEYLLNTALEMPDPWEALVFYLEETMKAQIRDKGMAQILSGNLMGAEAFDNSRDRVAPLVNSLVERAVQAGVVREDAVGTDLIFLEVGILSIARLLEAPGAQEIREDAHEVYRRYLWLALESLRKHGSENLPLPIPPLSTDQGHQIFSLPASKTQKK